MYVELGQLKGLRVRYEDCDALAVPGAPVTFEIVGDAGGSELSALSATTGSDGVATVNLTGGGVDATFQITATAPEGSALTFEVTVTGNPTGSITVEMSYTGSESLDQFTAYLFEGQDCAGLTPFDLPTGDGSGRSSYVQTSSLRSRRAAVAAASTRSASGSSTTP